MLKIDKVFSILKENLRLQNLLFLIFCLKKNKLKKVNSKNFVMVEFNYFSGCMISYFYFMNSFYKINKVNFYLFNINLKQKISHFFFYFLFFLIGVRKNVNFYKIKKLSHLNDYKKFKNKKDVLNYTKYNFNIGIDIYEGFLRTFNKPTVDIKDKKFKIFFLDYLAYFEDMFKFVKLNKSNLKAIIVFQTLYKTNMLCKIAYSFKIPVYLPDIEKLHKNEKPFDEVAKFSFYKKRSSKIKDMDKKINSVIKTYKKRVAGIQPAELAYSTALLTNKQKKYQDIFEKNKKIKVLICTHCFYDNPHPYEKSAFPDYYEWLRFLCEISKKTNYSWRIKVHNDCLPGTIETIQEIVKVTRSNILILPQDITHSEIIKSKVTHVLTCHGTVGFEYPYFKVPVINFNYNPRISFNFNLHANNNIKNYKNIIFNLHKHINYNIKIRDIFISYFMHYHQNCSNLFINNFYKTQSIANIKSNDVFFREFLKQLNYEKEKNIEYQLNKFIVDNINYLAWNND